MIPLVLWQLRWRLLVLLLVGWFFYLNEPGFHQHEEVTGALPPELAPAGVAFSLANLAGIAMLVLLWGSVSADRARGYARIHFSHPTRPLAYYALRWAIAYVVAVAAAGVFLVFGQLAAWGELRVGVEVMPQAFLFALIYGALVAFFSVVLPVGDGLAALGVFAVTEFWYALRQNGIEPGTPAFRSLVGFVLPPHLALNDVYGGVLAGALPWGAVLYAAGYGLFWLLLAGALLHFREWP